jgi:hypothetical protein
MAAFAQIADIVRCRLLLKSVSAWQSDCHASMTAPIHFAGISMIIVMTRYAQDEQIQAVVDKIRAAG